MEINPTRFQARKFLPPVIVEVFKLQTETPLVQTFELIR
jgi:hypothetical protein